MKKTATSEYGRANLLVSMFCVQSTSLFLGEEDQHVDRLVQQPEIKENKSLNNNFFFNNLTKCFKYFQEPSVGFFIKKV